MTIDVRKQTMRPDWENIEKPSWQRAVKKWLNFQSGEEEFHSDCDRKSCTDEDLNEVPPKHLSSSSSPSSVYSKDALNIDDSLNLRMLVGTWNVGGKSGKAEEEFNLKDCFTTSPAFADIYVLGFQEMVPLNAGNVLGLEGKGEAERWIALISQSLNNNCNDDDDESFELVGSKQMVGIFLCVWARSSLCPLISNLSISCVATGAMGLLGNKGSVSISMTLSRVTFCFVCTHLASGHKPGDEFKRNSDVAQILSSTRFDRRGPQRILDHDNVIWLGDLNYRLAADDSTYELLNKQDWQTLLLKDQLRIEQKCGRVFQGWEEGKINFAPTYKYLDNSDIYYYVSQSFKARHKQRIPAWCDRILWKGEGIRQEWYVRGESKFSDHRPVYSLFQLSANNNNSNNNQNPKRHLNSSHSHQQQHKSNAVVPSSFAKVQAEELLPVITTPKLSCGQ